MKISELMTRTVQVCHATDSLERAAGLMWDHDIGALPVVDAHDRVVGMITDRDICMAAYTRGAALREIPVEVAMANNVVTCGADDSDTAVAEIMAKHKIRRVPVVDEAHRPIGMLSLNDLARTMARGRDVPASSVAGTLAAISEHRDGAATPGRLRLRS
ncbi:MAG TPA: CBS domain-containing protein [Kofleriaceae bacterium]|nr:CBS domain-containing protein [Kofleriaceae bacterium]